MPSGVPLRDDSAAFASNWRVVLAVDFLMGLAVLVAGIVIIVLGSWWGTVLAVAGLVYLFFAGGRATRWRRLRQGAGL